MGTHHSHGLEIGLKMYLYYQPFMPESFSTSQNNCQISIKTREILHYINDCLQSDRTARDIATFISGGFESQKRNN